MANGRSSLTKAARPATAPHRTGLPACAMGVIAREGAPSAYQRRSAPNVRVGLRPTNGDEERAPNPSRDREGAVPYLHNHDGAVLQPSFPWPHSGPQQGMKIHDRFLGRHFQGSAPRLRSSALPLTVAAPIGFDPVRETRTFLDSPDSHIPQPSRVSSL